VAVAASIDATRRTLDIAAFELNNEVITQAILNAHNRGVVVRIVTDNEHGIEDDDTTLVELELAGIQIVNDNRSGLMHDKFMIMDGAILWMGSMNYTVNDVYRNNNNTMMLRSQRAVQVYQAEFNEMFERGEFGARSDQSNTASFNQDGVPIEVYFASENEVTDIVVREINAFSFTLDSMGFALVDRAEAGVDVQGVFETTGSLTQFSEMGRLFCAGMGIRQDGNNGVLHHKVFVIDESTVIFGSFNFSDSAASSNDENLMVIREPNIASLFLEEFARVQSIATVPTAVICR
jgi:phosphatidylserine/phosphatidylglycerophosphate/cardiolipin synthase-like enzyme